MKIIRYLGFLKYPFYTEVYEIKLRRKFFNLILLLVISLITNALLILSHFMTTNVNYRIFKAHMKYARTVINLKDLENLSLNKTNKTIISSSSSSSLLTYDVVFHPIEIRISNFEIEPNLDTKSVITHSTLDILQKIFNNEIRYRNERERYHLTTNGLKLEKCEYNKTSNLLKANVTIDNPPSSFNVFTYEQEYFENNIRVGGIWEPTNCYAEDHVAIIVPVKDRSEHLKIFLYHMHTYLQHQKINYKIFVVEQVNSGIFNKGLLMNSAYLEIVNMGVNFDCVIFHDVDLLPEDERNFYTCPQTVKHLGVAIDLYDYRLLYNDLVGGVLNFRKEYYVKVNGFTNRFWGWGGEDDDMTERLKYENITWTRANSKYARYKMLKHGNRVLNENRYKLLDQSLDEYKMDGLNSIKYELYGIIKYKLFTQIFINVGKP